jgi:hypothetical protein
MEKKEKFYEDFSLEYKDEELKNEEEKGMENFL